MKTIKPKQKRSEDRMNLLLDTTEALIAQNGVAGFALSHVARQSKVSQGSLYQYVDSKEALISALHRRHANRILQILDRFRQDMAGVASDDLPEVFAERIVTDFVPFYEENPSYGAIRQSSASLTEPVENNIDAQIIDTLVPLLKRSFSLADGSRYELIAAVLLEIADALLLQASAGDKWQDEARNALLGYLQISVREAQ